MSGWGFILIYVLAFTVGTFYFLVMFKRIKLKNPFQWKGFSAANPISSSENIGVSPTISHSERLQSMLADPAEPSDISKSASTPPHQPPLDEPAIPDSHPSKSEINTDPPLIDFELRLRVNLPQKRHQPTAAFAATATSGRPQTEPVLQLQASNKETGLTFLKRIATASQAVFSREKWISSALMLSVMILAFLAQNGLLVHKLQPGIWLLLGSAVLSWLLRL
jgi:hypothetical protein